MSAKEFVDNEIASHTVTIFSKSWCPYCKKTKALFAEKYAGADVAIYELDERDDGEAIQNYLREKTNQGTVPNVFVAQKHIGGNDDTQAAEKKGQLRDLIKL